MSKLKFIAALFFIATSFLSYGQQTMTEQTKVIAIVNRANWCRVCKEHAERFGNNITPYTTKGLSIVMNDLTDETTIEKSKADLKKSALYKQIYNTKRKGVGKMMQACGMLKGKNKNMASGIVTFIDAKTLKVLSETSIATPDAELKTLIENLLKS